MNKLKYLSNLSEVTESVRVEPGFEPRTLRPRVCVLTTLYCAQLCSPYPGPESPGGWSLT